ncbi:MAG: ABC transporter ATP-binding protein [Parachlamydiaceae bacterium]
MPLIEMRNVRKTYKNGEHVLIALNNIDLNIERGELIALTGPSGSGKTTLMHLLGCLDSPSSGRFILDKQEVSSLSLKELSGLRNRKIGFVFQNFHLLDDLNAVENILLPQLYGGIKEVAGREKAIQLLEIVGLGHRLFHYPAQLSGGQKQRLAIARALAMDPPILLADEPTGNLDSENADKIIDLFCEINQLRKTTVVLVTHEKAIANRAKRSIMIYDGNIASDIKKE